MSERFLSASTAFCVALVIGCSFSLPAIAADEEVRDGLTQEQDKHVKLLATYGKEQRKRDRALNYQKKGKIKKYQKFQKQSDSAKEKGERQLERALEFQNEGRFKRFVKHLKKSVNSGNETAATLLALLEAASNTIEDEKAPAVSTETNSRSATKQENSHPRILSPEPPHGDNGGAPSIITLPGGAERLEYLRSLDVDAVYADAQLGDAHALYLLSELHIVGIGGEQSNAIAYAMLLLAAERGSGRAINLLTIFAPKLVEVAEIADSDKIYQRWNLLIKRNKANSALVSG